MKKLISPLLFMIYTLSIIFCIETLKESSLTINTLNDKLTQQHEEIHVLKETIHNKNIEMQKYIDEIERLRTIRAKVTAYAPLDNQSGICADDTPTITSRGTLARRGVIAVDPDEIPYFTKVYVPGYGIASAEDTGGAIRNYTEGIAIDVLVDTYEEAMAWGVKYIDVYIK